MKKADNIQALADQYTILAANGRQLEEFCASFGLDFVPIAQSLKIDPQCFYDFTSRISFDKFCRLLEVLSTLANDECFGLRFGQFFKHGSTGPHGYGLANAPTFKDALNFVIKYTPNQVDFETLGMSIHNDRIIIDWSFSPLITKANQFTDFAAIVILRQLQNCGQSAFRVLNASLQRPAPTDKTLHYKYFSKKVRFGAEINEVTLPADLLGIANPSADPTLFEYMSEQCKETAKSLVRKKNIVTLLKEDFMRGMEENDRAIQDVARRLGMSERTLQRRLEDVGTNFWDLYENTRDELSTRLLRDTDLSLSEISHKVGYSSQSAYGRAIMRWHGKSPGKLREQLRKSQG